MRSPPLGPSGEDITWPDQVAPRSGKASSTRNLKPDGEREVRRLISIFRVSFCQHDC